MTQRTKGLGVYPFYDVQLQNGGLPRRLVSKIISLHAWYPLRSELRMFWLRLCGGCIVREFKKRKNLLVNIGAGDNGFDGWVNVDVAKKPKINCRFDCRKRLPFPNESVAVIYSEHFFEHLDYTEEVPLFLQECLRVLQLNGVLRLVVPDGEKLLRAYVSEGWEEISRIESLGRDHADPWVGNFRYHTKMEVVNQRFRQGYEHKYCYDFETLDFVLRFFGFRKVIKQNFGISISDRMCPDSSVREPESLYVEAVKI
jgi:predicted SAM-dependent methyltransferase